MNITKRNIAVCVILSIFTLGIYLIYWVVMMTKEAVAVKDKNDNAAVETILMLFIPLLGPHFLEKKFYEGCVNCGFNKKDRSKTYLILSIFLLGIVNLCLIQSDLNKLASACESGTVNKANLGINPQAYYAPQFANANAAYQNNEAAIIDELKKYKELVDSGIITQEQFDEKKALLFKYM